MSDPPTQFADVLEANRAYAEAFRLRGLPARAGRGLAVVTCMDSRIEPLAMLGLRPGDAKILRNAGARVTDDVLRTLVLAHHLLGVDRVLIVAHTDCRMAKSDDDEVHELILASAGIDARSLDFQMIDDALETLARDVQRVRSSPFLGSGVVTIGCLYDVENGRLAVVVP